MEKFTETSLARILCAVDEGLLMRALALRYETCPTTQESVESLLEILFIILDLLPLPAKQTLGKLAKRWLRKIIMKHLRTRDIRRILRRLEEMGQKQLPSPLR